MAASPAMKKLHTMVATSAIHNGRRDKGDYTNVCHPGTREKYLEDWATWAEKGPTDKRLWWAHAIAGAGKTALLRTLCQLLEERRRPFASFFTWQSDSKRNTLTHFPATIAHQLSRRVDALVPNIERAFTEDQLLLETSFENQMEQLVIKPLLNVKDEHHLIIVVDGLDELDERDQTQFLSFIPYFLSRLASLPISLLISSRPDAEIVGAFQHPKFASITRVTRLGASDKDIWKFVNDKFDDINLRYPNLQVEHGGQWPSHKKRAIMVRQSSGLFIWPTVAIDYIDKVKLGLGHNKRLDQVLSSADPKPWVASPLDNLYRTILQAHAPEDRTSFEFFHFKRRLALLCLPIDLGEFIFDLNSQLVDWTSTPARAIFGETLDELWDAVAGLSSLFSPRMPLSAGKSPTPSISHRSFRDFAFNRARCGDEYYLSSEQDLRTKVLCNLLKFFNTQQTYQSCAEMSAEFLKRAGDFLESYVKGAAVSEELGHCMDDITVDSIPPTWPLVTQVYLIVKLFGGLYSLAENLDFTERSRRREALLSKMTALFKKKAATAQHWDIALFRIALSALDLKAPFINYHSVRCWHISRSPQCGCVAAYLRTIIIGYRQALANSTLVKHASDRLSVAIMQSDVAPDCLDVLQFFLSLPETSQRATELSFFIPVIDYWIIVLLEHCPPKNDLYDALGPICTAPLSNLPQRDEEDSHELVEQFLRQTEAFNKYTERCQQAGIETNHFPPVRIPDGWWRDSGTREVLLDYGYEDPAESTSASHCAEPTTTRPTSDPQLSWDVWGVSTFAIGHNTLASDVEGAQQRTWPTITPPEPPHGAKPMSVPNAMCSEKMVIMAETKSTPARNLGDAQRAIFPTVASSQRAAHVGPVPASIEHTTALGTNRSVSDIGARALKRRDGVREFFKGLLRRRR